MTIACLSRWICLLVAVDHHVLDIGDLVLGQVDDADALGLVGRRHLGLGRRHADHLAFGDAVARRGAGAIDTQLSGARPARYDVEADIGQMPLEPAIEANAIVIGLHPILPHVQADALGRIGLGRSRRGRCRRLGDGGLGAGLAH